MRKIAAILILCLLSLSTLARPIKIPSYKELFEMSDVVAFLSVERIEILDSVSPDNPDPKLYQDYLAYCKIEHLLKGTTETNTIVIPFFQNPAGKPGFNGAMPAPFTQMPVKMDYLAFLKKSDGKIWKPAAGAHDAALSIKAIPMLLDAKYLQLPKKVTVHGVWATTQGAASRVRIPDEIGPNQFLQHEA